MIHKIKEMKQKLLLFSCLVACISLSAADSAKPWFWNSTTTSTDSLTADEAVKNSTSTTPSSNTEIDESTKNKTFEFSPVLLDGFLPSNITSGRSASAVLTDLFSDNFAPANVTKGRSNKALNLDFLGNVREGRIMNDDPGNRKLNLQGFIPIVSFSAKEESEDDKKSLAKSPKRQEDDLYYDGPYPPIPIDNEEQTKSQNYFIQSSDSSKNNRLGYQKSVDSVKQDRFGTRIQESKHQNNDFYIPPPQNSQPNKDRFVIVPDKEAVRLISAEEYHKRPTYSDSPVKHYPDNQGKYQFDNQGKYQFDNQGNHQSDNQGKFQFDNQGKYQPDNQGKYQFDNQGKFQFDNQGKYQSDNQGKYQFDNQNQGKYQFDNQNQGKYQFDNQNQGKYQFDNQGKYQSDNQGKHQSDNHKSESQGAGHFIVSSKPSKADEDQYAPAGPYPPQPLPTNERQPAKDTTAKQYGKQYDQEGIYELQHGNYIINNDEINQDKCICVPFYLCRNGYLTNYGRSLEKEVDIDERSARKISKRSTGNKTEEDESSTLPPYTEDIMARMIGLGNVQDSCGLLRRCCKVPSRRGSPGGLLPFSPDNYPIPHPDLSNLPPGLLPPGISIQQVPGNPEQAYIVNQGGYPGRHVNPLSTDGQPQEQQIIIVPQEVPHPSQNPHRRPRPVHPPSVHIPQPIRPQYPSTIRPNPNRSIRPIYPQRRPQAPSPVYPQEPVYQPQPSYPKPQPVYPPPSIRPPRPLYPQPDYTDVQPQLHQGQCGARNGLGVHGRVNNLQYTDDASEFGEYPWQAAILLKVGPGNNLFVCGGTLISSTWVATAAHCLKKHNADELKVRLGDWDVHRDDEFYPYVEKYVVEAVVHPDFYPGNLQNDLALLRLESPVDSSLPHISPACLPELNERFDSHRCWVTGWGKNAFGEQGEYQSVLKEVDVPMLGHKDCEYRLKQTRLGRSYNLHPGFLCAGGEPGKDACTGDGGSPLVCEKSGTWKVAGLVSWGIGCGQPGVPGIYVNIAKYRSWIDTVIGRYG